LTTATRRERIEEARAHLTATAKDKVVKAVDSVRFPGKLIESLPPGEIRRAIDGQIERQRRFPLDTANALRGRLRREGFTIFKKGSKGISYVCAVKRKFRVPGQTFAESIDVLIKFIEANPMITLRELPLKLLGFAPQAVPAVSPAPVLAEPGTAAPEAEAAAAGPAEPTLTPEQQEKLRRATMDLHWLVHEGYVTEFADGRLFTPPPMAEARARAAESAEGEEHDPENFPEVPAAAPAAAPAAPSPAVQDAPPPVEPAVPVVQEPPPSVEPPAAVVPELPSAAEPVPEPAPIPEPPPSGDTPPAGADAPPAT